MSNTVIPDEHHLIRHCPPKYIDEDGDVTSAAFKLNREKNETELSTYWPEYFSSLSYSDQVNEAKKDLARQRKIRMSHKIAILEVGITKKYVKKSRKEKDSRELKFVHTPINNDSHSSILNIDPDGDAIAELIFESVQDIQAAI